MLLCLFVDGTYETVVMLFLWFLGYFKGDNLRSITKHPLFILVKHGIFSPFFEN